jgi:hypothetical protein
MMALGALTNSLGERLNMDESEWNQEEMKITPR